MTIAVDFDGTIEKQGDRSCEFRHLLRARLDNISEKVTRVKIAAELFGGLAQKQYICSKNGLQ